jgi:hypothetical protein
VPPQTHISNSAERAVRTGKNHLISVFSSTHPDFPDDLWDRLLPYAETPLNVMRSWRSDPSLSAWSGLHCLSYDFAAHPIHPPGQLCLAFSDPDHRDTWAPHGDRAFTLGPALTHYRCQRVYVVSSRSERITLTLAHFPLPLFHFAASDLPPIPTPDPSATRPPPTLDGTDLIGRVFNDPDLGLCRVVEVGPLHRLAPGEGNLDPTGPHLQAGWVPTLRYTSLGGATHTSSVTEVAEWVQTLAPSDLPLSPPVLSSPTFPPPSPRRRQRPLPSPPTTISPPPPPPHPPIPTPTPHVSPSRRSPRLQALLSSASAVPLPCLSS